MKKGTFLDLERFKKHNNQIQCLVLDWILIWVNQIKRLWDNRGNLNMDLLLDKLILLDIMLKSAIKENVLFLEVHII